MGDPAVSNYSYEDYLLLEEKSDFKNDYWNGTIKPKAESTIIHAQITANAIRAIGNSLIGSKRSDFVFGCDIRIHISNTDHIFYPDGAVVSGSLTPSKKDPNAITNPTLILEVLPESGDLDRGTKFTHYRQLESLREYVLVSQKEAAVDTFYRTDDGNWEIKTIMGTDGIVKLKSIDCEVRMADIYRLVPEIGE